MRRAWQGLCSREHAFGEPDRFGAIRRPIIILACFAAAPRFRLIVPVAVTAGDKIEGLRQWASGRCLSADRAGVYSRSEGVSGGRVRRVVREPGVN